MPTREKATQERPKEEPRERSPMFEGARKVLLAGIGAMALTKDEIENFVEKLVERGEIAEQDGKSLMHEIMEKRGKRTAQIEEQISKRAQNLLKRMDVPTKADFEALSKKIAELSRKVDNLKEKE